MPVLELRPIKHLPRFEKLARFCAKSETNDCKTTKTLGDYLNNTRQCLIYILIQ